MENGGSAAFVSPTSLPPQAHLSAAFQAANAANNGAAAVSAASIAGNMNHFHEALMTRMGRPFGLSGADMKDLAASSPFLGLAAAGRSPSGAGGLEGFPAAGLPFLSHMAAASGHPAPFLHHFVDPRHPFSAAAAAAAAGAAFRPFLSSSLAATSTSASIVSRAESSPLGKSFNSAFQPPPGSKLDTKGTSPTLFSPGQNLFPRSSSAGSHGSPSSSPPTSFHSSRKTDENSNTNALLGHGGHLDRTGSVSPASLDSNHTGDGSDDHRMGAAKKFKLGGSSEYGCSCPICGLPLRPSELEAHYNQELEVLAKYSAALLISQKTGFKSPHALQLSPRPQGSTEVAPRSRWDTFQRIQRNRQSRIRVKLSRRAAKRQDEILEEEDDAPKAKHAKVGDDEDIDIVGEDRSNESVNSTEDGAGQDRSVQNRVYGPPQFTEADVLAVMKEHVKTEDEKENNNDKVGEDASNENDDDDQEKRVKKERDSCDSDHDDTNEDKTDSMDNVEHLKAKLKRMEENNNCSKCTKTLKSPVVNVGCWHIQCEKCWLLSLGANKRCSLCGVTCSPTDLRRVYL